MFKWCGGVIVFECDIENIEYISWIKAPRVVIGLDGKTKNKTRKESHINVNLFYYESVEKKKKKKNYYPNVLSIIETIMKLINVPATAVLV